MYRRVRRNSAGSLAGSLNLPKTAGFLLHETLPDAKDDAVKAALEHYRQACDGGDGSEDLTAPSARGTSSTDDAGDDSDENAASDPNFYQLQETAADHVLLMSSVTRQLRETLLAKGALGYGGSLKLHGYSLVAWGVLYFVFLMQLGIVYKLRDITSYYSTDSSEKLLDPKRGVCTVVGHRKEDVDSGSWFLPVVYSCSPPPLDFASHWRNLDRDGDGVWTAAEAAQADEELPRIKAELLFDHFMAKLRKQKSKEDGATLIYEDSTKQFTEIPEAAYKDPKVGIEKDLLTLCRALDHRLCSNLELENGLLGAFPDDRFPSKRIAKCEAMVQNHCDFFGGETYKTFQVRHADLCGDYQIRQIMGDGVREAQFSEVVKYNNPADGVTTLTFSLFLAVILALWLMVLLAEFKLALRMGLLLAWLPVAVRGEDIGGGEGDQSGRGFGTPSIGAYGRGKDVEATGALARVTVYTKGEKAFRILALQDYLHKFQLLLFVFLPRIAILCGVAWVGTEFLTSNFGYLDLILNAVALGFVVDVDKLAFASFSSRARRLLLSSCQPVRFAGTNTSGNSFQALRFKICDAFCCDGSIVFPFLLVLGTGFFVALRTQYGPGGLYDTAHALSCFCNMEGRFCVGSKQFVSTELVPYSGSSPLVKDIKMLADLNEITS